MVEAAVIAGMVQNVAIKVERRRTAAIEVQRRTPSEHLHQMSQLWDAHADGIAWRAAVDGDEQHAPVLRHDDGTAWMLRGDEVAVALLPVGMVAMRAVPHSSHAR